MAPEESLKTRRLSRRDVEAACRGDRDARKRVARKLYDHVRSTVFYLTRNETDAEDIVQQSLIEILRALPSYRAEAKLETWADRITVRTAMHFFKKGRKRRELTLSREEEDDERGGAASGLLSRLPDRATEAPDRQTIQAQMRNRLARLLQQMPEERRTAVVLRWVHGYSIEEIASMTEVRVNTARGRLRKGKKELRQLILSDPVLRDWADLVMP